MPEGLMQAVLVTDSAAHAAVLRPRTCQPAPEPLPTAVWSRTGELLEGSESEQEVDAIRRTAAGAADPQLAIAEGAVDAKPWQPK